MEFISSNWRDIQKYFQGTFIKFEEFGDRLFYITDVSPDRVSGIDENEVAFELFLSDSHPYTVNYILPHKAVFQYKDNALLLQRIPARQYRRGICSDNIQIVNVVSKDKLDVTWSVLKAFVNKPMYSSFSAAFTAKERVKSLALTPRMSYVRGSGRILIDLTPIATFSYSDKIIRMDRKIFLPEVMEHLKAHNEDYEVQ